MLACRSARRLFTALSSLFLISPAPAAEPVVDIVVTSNLATKKEHVDAYRSALRDEVAGVLTSLEPARETDDGKPPADGAARFRLFVEHAGSASIGDTLKVFSAHPIKSQIVGNKIVLSPDKTKYRSDWYLTYSHRGSATLRLAEWKAGKYQTLLSWTVTLPGPYDAIDRKGLIEVASLAQDTAKAPINFNPMCPKKLEDARTEALLQVMPGEFKDKVCTALVPGRIVKVKKTEDGAAADLNFQNKSPWPIKSVKVAVMTTSNLIVGSGIGGGDIDVEFAQPLAPGKSITQTVAGSATQADPGLIEQKPGVTVREVIFVPGK